MNKQQNIDNAAAVFSKNKGIRQLYFTNDGQAFTDLEPARTHQKEVSGSIDGLHLVKNAGYDGPAVSVTEDVVNVEEMAEVEEKTEMDGKVKGKKQ